MEFLKNQEPVKVESSEKLTGPFPVIDTEETYYYEGKPEFVPGSIVHYFTGVSSNEKKHRFVLEQVVGGLTYIFKLGEEWTPQSYGLSFKTDEYEFATVNLSEEDQAALGKTIAAFIETVSQQAGVEMQEIKISPANAGYTAEEIEKCTEEILASPENSLSKGELLRKYKGFEIFDLYRELFDKDFEDKHYNDKNRAPARSRYFKNMFRKYLSGWKAEEIPVSFADFLLRKNE